MKIRAECEAISKIHIPGPVEIEHEDRKYTFIPNETGVLTKLEIQAPILRPELFRSEIVNTPGQPIKAHVTIRTDDTLLNALQEDFQLIESLLAFNWNLSHIRWDTMKWDLIFDTEEERHDSHIFGLQMSREMHDRPERIDRKSLHAFIQTKSRYQSLAVPLAFYREGKLDYRSLKFINAFFNFYFIIEGLYGGRKTKNYAIEAEFKKSKNLCQAVKEALRNMKRSRRDIYNRLLKGMQANSDPLDVDAVISYIVGVRGCLHHFTDNPNRLEGTPFTHDEFEPVAELTRAISTFGLMFEVVKLNQAAKGT